MIKVSIIIPYHNVEAYISQCLESVVNQTLTDIEIIMINDASTDNSKKIVEDFAQNDNRIIMLETKELSGQANARNIGLKIAQGEYIGFVDSDDWIDTSMFEKLYNKAKFQDSDITMCCVKLYDDETSEFSENDYYSLKSLEKYSNDSFSPEDTKHDLLNINVVIWNKIYKRYFLESTKEKLADGFIYEDLPFFFGTYLKANKINIVWEYLYFYRQNRKYSTMQNIDKKVYDRIPMVSLAYEKLKQANFYKEIEIDVLSWIIDDIFHRFTLLEEKYYKEYFYDMKKLFQSFGLEGDEKNKLIESYCFDEYCNIVQSNYVNFQKFLIEKYKKANKKVKAIKHERNETIKEIKSFWNEYKIEEAKEKEDIINWWRYAYNNLQQTKNNEKTSLNNMILNKQNEINELLNKIEKIKIEYNDNITSLNDNWTKYKNNKEEEIKNIQKQHQDNIQAISDENNVKLVNQAYELKKWQAKSIKEKEEKITADFKWKIEQINQEYKKELKNQKDYYENNFFSVKMEIKIRKFIGQFINKIKKLLKKN